MVNPVFETADDRAWLEAGWEIVREELGWELVDGSLPETSESSEDEAPKLLDLISAREVSHRLNVSVGKFYRRWTTRRAYVDALAAYILDHERHDEYLTRVLGEFDERVGRREPIESLIPDLAKIDLEGTARSPAFAVQMHLWSVSRRFPRIQMLLRAMYRSIDDQWSRRYSMVVSLLGWRLRDSLTVAEGTLLLTALGEGMAIRRAVDPELACPELFSKGIMALVLGIIDAGGDGLSLEAKLKDVFSNQHGET
jgi:AcrR family transcriptional regulator